MVDRVYDEYRRSPDGRSAELTAVESRLSNDDATKRTTRSIAGTYPPSRSTEGTAVGYLSLLGKQHTGRQARAAQTSVWLDLLWSEVIVLGALE